MSARGERKSAILVTDRQSDPTLLVERRATDDPAYPGFLSLPTAEVHSADAAAESPEDAARIAALRALFVATGWLFASGPPVDDAARRILHEAFVRDPGEGFARMQALRLRFRSDELAVLGRRRVGGDLPEAGEFALYRLIEHDWPERVPPAIGEGGRRVEGVSLARLRSDWGVGDVLLAPPLDAAVGELRAGGSDAFPATSTLYEVVPGVRIVPLRTPTPPPATHTNAFVVGTRDAVLVEPASPHPDEIERLVDLVDAFEARGFVFRALLATHHHRDHIGGALAIARRLGLPLWAHAETAARLPKIAFDRLLADGERIELDGPEQMTLEAVHTPGHAPGHLCFRDLRSGAMIAGDMVAGMGTVLVDPIDGDMALYLDSLRRMAAHEPTVLLPAHGGPIAEPGRLLDRYAAHRKAREERILAALLDHSGPATAWDLLPTAYADAPRRAWPYAAMTAEAHLIKLAREGRAVRKGKSWVPA